MLKNLINIFFNSMQLVSDKLNNYDVKDAHMINFVCVYFILLFTLFLVGWMQLWWIAGKADLLLLLKGIETLTAPAALSAIKFVTDKVSQTKIIIDKNKNGIDDRLENLKIDKPSKDMERDK